MVTIIDSCTEEYHLTHAEKAVENWKRKWEQKNLKEGRYKQLESDYNALINRMFQIEKQIKYKKHREKK